ncbi:MAG: lipoprotein, partial [Firmicutes bacterium]|nr:lipoprotein [Bacillota bacterium]
MKCLARWSAWVLALVMLTTLTGCGQKPNKTSKPSLPVIRYALNTSSSLLTLPLQIALKLHFFEDEHIQVKRVPPLH